jgi:hypothetical protein
MTRKDKPVDPTKMQIEIEAAIKDSRGGRHSI